MSNIQLSSGGYLNLLSPKVSDIHIEDIAHGLSNICRFNGQTEHFYSVAQHSVFVSYFVPPHLQLQALLHDASEAYIGDVSSPLKALLPENVMIEKRMETVISKRFYLPEFKSSSVKTADILALVTEKHDLMPKNINDFVLFPLLSKMVPDGEKLVCLPPQKAKELFLNAFLIYTRWNEINRKKYNLQTT